MAENLEQEMVAVYAVSITGIKRSKAEMARLDGAIRSLRSTQYSSGASKTPGPSVAEIRFGKGSSSIMRTALRSTDRNGNPANEFFIAQIDQLEGAVQSAASRAMASAMAKGKATQALTLRAAETATGASGRPKGRKSAGREVTGALIKGISTNVDTQKVAGVTQIVGSHGWQRERPEYFDYQEEGTKGAASGQTQPLGKMETTVNRKVQKRRDDAAAGDGVPAANSLGASIIVVREYLKEELGKLL